MAQNGESARKPSVLIIGGLGYIGRNLSAYLHRTQSFSTIRIVDKLLPQLANLAPEHVHPCRQEIYVQADASRPASLPRIFDHPDVPGGRWTYIFNLGGETAWSQSYELYRLRSHELSLNLANEAARRGCGAFIEASTGMVYASNRTPRIESDKLKPWTALAKVKLETEAELSRIFNLPLLVVRLPHVYGPYDKGFVSKALCLARVYQEQNKEMKWLWSEDLCINTLHINDCVRALLTAASWRMNNSSIPPPPPRSQSGTAPSRNPLSRRSTNSSDPASFPLPTTPIFNLCDASATSQSLLAHTIAEVFSIKTGFQNALVSQFAKLNLDHVVDDLNDEVLGPWAEMLEAEGLGGKNVPLSPFLEKDVVRDCELSLDSGLFCRETGWRAEKRFGVESVREMVESYKRMEWWP